jgi:hypothetical protein
MNRKIIFLLIFIFSNNYSLFAQNSNATQSETEEWILQKLNNYIVEVDGRKLLNKENEFYDNFVKDISFDFNGCDLICTYKRIKDRSPLYGFIHGSMKFDVTIRIPV